MRFGLKRRGSSEQATERENVNFRAYFSHNGGIIYCSCSENAWKADLFCFLVERRWVGAWGKARAGGGGQPQHIICSVAAYFVFHDFVLLRSTMVLFLVLQRTKPEDFFPVFFCVWCTCDVLP